MKKNVVGLMQSDHLDQPCIQKHAHYASKKIIWIQRADFQPDETEREKNISRLGFPTKQRKPS